LSQPHWRYALDGAPRLERLLDEMAPPFDAGSRMSDDGERTRGVATLRAQSLCAFRGFAETRLRSEALERPTPGFNDMERGNLVHSALEHIWSALRNSTSLMLISPAERTRLLDESIARAIAKVCLKRDPGMRWRFRESLRMRSVLDKWLDVECQRQPFEVEGLEHGKQAAIHAGLEFMVRVDRVDRLSDGARVLIDYKTGIAAADWRGDRPDNPQLPIYALLRPEALVAVAYGQVNAHECRFVAESERSEVFKARGQKTKLEGMSSLAELIEVWARRIETLAANFGAGHAEVAPSPGACKFCHLQSLCRISTALDDDELDDGEEGSSA
jgi:ATP-dependent helicase/nuclease subunit B